MVACATLEGGVDNSIINIRNMLISLLIRNPFLPYVIREYSTIILAKIAITIRNKPCKLY